MREPAYPAARSVASKLEEYFARHHREAVERGETGMAPLPDAATMEEVIDAAFWASLLREEGYETRISLAFLTPEDTAQPLRFERSLTLEAGRLTKVAPAVERAGIHLCVWRDGDGLRVWGTTRVLPPLCFVLEVAAPGLLVIKHHRGEELGKFLNVAVLEGDQIKIVDEKASSLPDCPELLSSMLGFDSPASWTESVNVLVQLAVSMRGHGRGGSLLVVPPGSETWRESVVQPIPYAVSPAFSELAELLRDRPDDQGIERWQETLTRAVDWIAGLTAVDGAAVMTRDHELLGFGAKIARRKMSAQVEEVMVTEPIEGGTAARVRPEQLGGTRHLSAAQFVHDQRDSIALVASQDGRFTVFAWSTCEEMVHAHRVETLLL
uniref:Probable sensor domain-containing protein n=1 Tax=Solibacter usitatus (strain Ellin6076) TaxID=234267 RepID=Q027C5_SOLUE